MRDAERRFPVRIRIALPPKGFGSRLDQIFAWLDANCGADGWISMPLSTRGVLNDVLASISPRRRSPANRHPAVRGEAGRVLDAMTTPAQIGAGLIKMR